MNIPRNFLLTGTGFLIIGLAMGMYMGASGDHSLAASHAHINLVGFVLAVVFALTYKSYPSMCEGRLPKAHFLCSLLGAVGLNTMLLLLLSGAITEAAMVPLAPLSELLVVLGVLIFAWNVLKFAK